MNFRKLIILKTFNFINYLDKKIDDSLALTGSVVGLHTDHKIKEYENNKLLTQDLCFLN